ncbi:probable low-specificity L-threonine aldolase 2 isoform X2 [Pomacea canaliculata]|nr:probable low-specificity L-threonine aldolase 2 isoform X2 [Pomacea canaliculata]XP_025081303.1 probable low-specificity L-threonine aldolase 2 isoform X2 [Pomacea canaliculata]XP_025081311.1 probable low-specificity L-threonine aldolase 2 isoform X2 [Pomacea canaliculata]
MSTTVTRYFLSGKLKLCHHQIVLYGTSAASSKNDIYVVNLRSDTFTLPTSSMKKAMVEAHLGDDVYGEDPTVNRLQKECATLLGKDAALLIPTGTMGNTAAMLSHCHGLFEEILLGDQSHMHFGEVGAIATLAGIHSRTVTNKCDGTMDINELREKIRIKKDPHYPQTRVICLENTHNRCGGTILPLNFLEQVRDVADAHHLAMHLDGARLMHAAVAQEVAPCEIAQYFDSVSMCFSKGLACPVGSILAGSKDFIERALWARKALGGGMRQAGVIAAPMLVALNEIVPHLREDHARARKIAQAIVDVKENNFLKLNMELVQTNIGMLHMDCNISTRKLCERLTQVTDEEFEVLGERISVQMMPFSDTLIRFVTYYGITDKDVDKAIKKLQYVLTGMSTC